jgi:ABC-2 type transport system ATP-binding protein
MSAPFGDAFGVADLEVRYGRHAHRPAVSGISFELAPGSLTALVGADGAGKSTVLRALVGVLAPAAGRVVNPGRRGIGYVSAGPGIWRDLTVAENLAFTASAYHLRPADADARTRELLDRTGLADATDRLAGRLSGGMRQKLALACALLPEPKLLALDEATTGVDPVSRAELWRLIAGAAAAGAAVVLATTYLDEAERAGTAVVLHRGRQLAAGPPDELVAAMPGAVWSVPDRPSAGSAWRRGRTWRVWTPDAQSPPRGTPVTPRLEDAVIVATLERVEVAA